MTAPLDLSAVRAAIAAAFAAAGVTTYPTQTGMIDPPAAVVGNPDIRYHVHARGGTEVSVPVTLYAPQTDEAAAIAQLDTWLGWGPSSLIRTVEYHTTNAWRSVAAEDSGDYRAEQLGDMTAMTATVRYTIHT